jgi:hypothetical protein
MHACAGAEAACVQVLHKWREAGHKALLFTQTQQMLDILETHVAAAGMRYLRMDGATPAATRFRMIDAFNRDPPPGTRGPQADAGVRQEAEGAVHEQADAGVAARADADTDVAVHEEADTGAAARDGAEPAGLQEAGVAPLEDADAPLRSCSPAVGAAGQSNAPSHCSPAHASADKAGPAAHAVAVLPASDAAAQAELQQEQPSEQDAQSGQEQAMHQDAQQASEGSADAHDDGGSGAGEWSASSGQESSEDDFEGGCSTAGGSKLAPPGKRKRQRATEGAKRKALRRLRSARNGWAAERSAKRRRWEGRVRTGTSQHGATLFLAVLCLERLAVNVWGVCGSELLWPQPQSDHVCELG